jgi:hypothetical protein
MMLQVMLSAQPVEYMRLPVVGMMCLGLRIAADFAGFAREGSPLEPAIYPPASAFDVCWHFSLILDLVASVLGLSLFRLPIPLCFG